MNIQILIVIEDATQPQFLSTQNKGNMDRTVLQIWL